MSAKLPPVIFLCTLYPVSLVALSVQVRFTCVVDIRFAERLVGCAGTTVVTLFSVEQPADKKIKKKILKLNLYNFLC
jgi:hypothetical protein